MDRREWLLPRLDEVGRSLQSTGSALALVDAAMAEAIRDLCRKPDLS